MVPASTSIIDKSPLEVFVNLSCNAICKFLYKFGGRIKKRCD